VKNLFYSFTNTLNFLSRADPMASPSTVSDFINLVRKSGLLDEQTFSQLVDLDLPDEPFACAETLVRHHMLTPFQAKQLLAGRHRGLVLGAYKILRPLGKGGMGVVYLADHAGLGRKVAIKVLTNEQAREKLALERFQREARAAAALDHPNIVRLHDITQVSGINFLVMEYVEGVDLQSLVQQAGALHYAQAANYIAQAAAGLAHAHERGFIHRDIKPANLILGKEGTVKILDMGLARSVLNPKDALTGKLGDDEDMITGTADYLSPEQALNVTLDARSDIYSLGATLFTLVTGRPPFDGSTAQKLAQHQVAPPPNLNKIRAAVPEDMGDVVARMMAKKPADRYQTMQEVLDDLAPWLPDASPGGASGRSDTSTGLRKDSTSRKLPRKKARKKQEDGFQWLIRDRRFQYGAGGVGVLLLAVILYAAFGGSSKKNDTAEKNSSPPAVTPPGNNSPNSGSNRRPPVPASSGASLYKIGFANLPPASQTVDAPGRATTYRELGGVMLPAGVAINHWDGKSSGVYSLADVDGSRALGMRQTVGNGGVQVHFKCAGRLISLAYGATATVRLTYAHDGMDEGAMFVEQRKQNEYPKYGMVALPPTNGAWKTVDLTFVRPDEGDDFELVVRAMGTTGVAARGTIWVRSVEVYDGAAPAPTPAFAGRSIFKLNLAAVKPFRFTIQDRRASDPDAGTHAPSGVLLHCWKQESVAEFRGEVAEGRASIGVANLNDNLSAQMLFQPDAGLPINFVPGKTYGVRLEYRALNDAEGRVDVRNPKANDFSSVAGAQLEPTGGTWKTVDLTFKRPAEGSIDICLVNNAVGEGNIISVRSLEVFEIEK